jgi:hypothetical protein
MDEKLVPKLTVAAIGLPMLTGAGPGGESVASTSKVTGSAWAAATCIADNAATNDRQKARGKRCLNKLWTKPLQSLANTRTGSDEIPFTLPPLNLSVVDCESTARTGCTVRLQIAFQAFSWRSARQGASQRVARNVASGTTQKNSMVRPPYCGQTSPGVAPGAACF